MNRRLSAVALAAVLGIALAACGGNDSDSTEEAAAGGVPDTLRVGLIPNIAPEEQQAKYEPFGEYLEETLDTEVELFVAADYAGVVTALASDRIDMAYLGGLTYVQAAEQTDLTPLVTEIDALTGTQQYDSAIVVADDSRYEATADLLEDQASFAFGDPASTSGSLYPRIMLTDAGVECDTTTLTDCPPLSEVTFTGGHDATAQAVLSGKVDAGGLELRILRALEKDGAVPEGELRVIETARVQGYPWVARTDLGDEAHEEIVNAFTSIDDAALLELLRAESYVAVTDDDYAEVREQATNLGLLTTS
jgi:phosphonate transport system substrate-binding protein